jgi:hypothetical protein
MHDSSMVIVAVKADAPLRSISTGMARRVLGKRGFLGPVSPGTADGDGLLD